MSWNDKNFRMIEMHTESIASGLVAFTACRKSKRNGLLSTWDCPLTPWSEVQRASMTALKGPPVSCSCQASECGKQAQCLSLGTVKL